MSDALLAVPVPVKSRRLPIDGAALLAAADADAAALADRLHDGALQALVVARYAADAAARGGDPALARDAVQDALVALRRAVWLVRPRGAEDLPGALAELSAQRVAAGAPPLELALDPRVAAAMSAAARVLAYRFVQAVAHGPASVALDREGAHATLSVAGTVPDVPGWTARAGALGGRLESGPTPRLLLPLSEPDPEGDR
jgi:hypothetical protein